MTKTITSTMISSQGKSLQHFTPAYRNKDAHRKGMYLPEGAIRGCYGCTAVPDYCDPACDEDATCKNNQCSCNAPLAGDGVMVCRDKCICRLRGDPIVETSDGNVLLLSDDLKYTFSKRMDPEDECAFNIEVKIGQYKNTDITYPRFVDVEVYGLRVRLENDGSATLAGGDIQLPSTNLDKRGRLNIYQNAAGYTILDTSCGIQLAFEPKNVVTLIVPSTLAIKEPALYGLCGDCNGLPDDLVKVEKFVVDESDNGFKNLNMIAPGRAEEMEEEEEEEQV